MNDATYWDIQRERAATSFVLAAAINDQRAASTDILEEIVACIQKLELQPDSGVNSREMLSWLRQNHVIGWREEFTF